MASNKEEYVSVFFSDIKGYSKLDEQGLHKIEDLNDEIEDELRQNEHLIHFNTAGDGVFIIMNDVVELAKFAILFRDKIRNTCWQLEIGGLNDIKVRIGLHFGKATVRINNDGKVKNVIGINVITGARIEPIVTPNDVFCSGRFYDILKDDFNKKHKIKGYALGEGVLAKDYGKANLYKLCWDWEYDLINNSNNNYSQNIKEKVQQSTSNNQDDSTINITSNTMKLKFNFINNSLEINKKEKEIYFKNSDKIYIGRSSAKLENGIVNQIVLPNNNKGISRFHGYFEIENKKVKVVDWDNLKEKKSENGIIINGTKIDGKEYLSNGDLLKFGNYEVLIYLEGEDTSDEYGDGTIKNN